MLPEPIINKFILLFVSLNNFSAISNNNKAPFSSFKFPIKEYKGIFGLYIL